jgi:hypothetical protein
MIAGPRRMAALTLGPAFAVLLIALFAGLSWAGQDSNRDAHGRIYT